MPHRQGSAAWPRRRVCPHAQEARLGSRPCELGERCGRRLLPERDHARWAQDAGLLAVDASSILGKHADAQQPLRAWFGEAERADWTGPQDIKNRYRSADFLSGDRVVFNIKGNKYRLIVAIKYEFKAVYVRFVGTHAEYDAIDAENV